MFLSCFMWKPEVVVHSLKELWFLIRNNPESRLFQFNWIELKNSKYIFQKIRGSKNPNYWDTLKTTVSSSVWKPSLKDLYLFWSWNSSFWVFVNHTKIHSDASPYILQDEPHRIRLRWFVCFSGCMSRKSITITIISIEKYVYESPQLGIAIVVKQLWLCSCTVALKLRKDENILLCLCWRRVSRSSETERRNGKSVRVNLIWEGTVFFFLSSVWPICGDQWYIFLFFYFFLIFFPTDQTTPVTQPFHNFEFCNFVTNVIDSFLKGWVKRRSNPHTFFKSMYEILFWLSAAWILGCRFWNANCTFLWNSCDNRF